MYLLYGDVLIMEVPPLFPHASITTFKNKTFSFFASIFSNLWFIVVFRGPIKAFEECLEASHVVASRH